jgi:hypothetical protein
MRFAVLAMLALLAGCNKNASKLDATREAEVDALWDLAPDGTQLGIVATPRSVGLAFGAIATIRELANQPDFAPAKPQIDALAKAMFGSETATPEDAGYASDRSFAMFATSDGVLGVMPVGNRDKFMAAKHGTRGSVDDTLEQNTCRELGKHYMCATKVEMFERIGKGKLRGKLGAVGARGDAELLAAGVPMLGENKGDILLAAQLEPGQVSVHARWLGTPDGLLQRVAGIIAPKPDTHGASGFAALNVKPLLDNAPPVPLAGGVTLDQLAKSLAGTITAVIPSGSVDIQLFVPLVDAKPAETVIANCQDVGKFFELAKTQTPGACRIVLQGTNALELDAWVENATLRLGAKQGPLPPGKPEGMTPAGSELGSGTWTAAFWGRGTMLNLSGITPTQQQIPAQVALGIHAMALVNELGAGVRVDQDGVRLRAIIRTAWTNPPAVTGQIVKITGEDIITGKATEPAKKIAASAPGTPFAADFAAGQGGLMVPAAMIGLASAIAIPAVMRLLGADTAAESPTGEPPMTQSDLVTLLLRAYSEEAYPKWQANHPKQKCPASLAEVAKYFGDTAADLPTTKDPWGNPLVMKCDDKGFSVMSVGPDGKAGTDDDVRVP